LTCLWDPEAKNRVRRRRFSESRNNSAASLSSQSEGNGNANGNGTTTNNNNNNHDVRAKKNWLRAKRVVIKKLTEDTLSVQRKIRTMFQILSGVKGS